MTTDPYAAVWLALAVLSLRLDIADGQNTTTARKHQIGLFKFPDDYESKSAPVPSEYLSPDDNITDGRLRVGIKFEIWSIVEISPEKMEMQVDMYVTLYWVDVRLLPTPSDEEGLETVPEEMAVRIWHPYVVFRNCKGCLPLDIDPKKFTYLYDRTTKALSVSVRILKSFGCQINLRSYPLDKQLCKIQMENYYEEQDQVLLYHIFEKEQETVLSNMSLSEYEIGPITPTNCTIWLYQMRLSCVELQVPLVRYFGFYWMTLYAPSILIVLLSWVSFWLPNDATPARVTLGVTSLLTLATRLDQSQKNLPPVSYAKAIDVWMFACLFLVFASLIEFAIGFFLWRKFKDVQPEIISHPVIKIRSKTIRTEKVIRKPNMPALTRLDVYSRAVFPLAFLIFNIFYWSTYVR